MSYIDNIGLVCDSCGKIVGGCTYVNGMKFCDKCYQETFGEKVNQCNHCSFKSANDILAEKIENLEQENKKLKEQLVIREKALEFAVSYCQREIDGDGIGMQDIQAIYEIGTEFFINKAKEQISK